MKKIIKNTIKITPYITIFFCLLCIFYFINMNNIKCNCIKNNKYTKYIALCIIINIIIILLHFMLFILYKKEMINGGVYFWVHLISLLILFINWWALSFYIRLFMNSTKKCTCSNTKIKTILNIINYLHLFTVLLSIYLIYRYRLGSIFIIYCHFYNCKV